MRKIWDIFRNPNRKLGNTSKLEFKHQSELNIITYYVMSLIVCYFSPRIDREVSVEVTSTEPLEYFTYQILGRGDIIVTQTESV